MVNIYERLRRITQNYIYTFLLLLRYRGLNQEIAMQIQPTYTRIFRYVKGRGEGRGGGEGQARFQPKLPRTGILSGTSQAEEPSKQSRAR